MYFLAALSLSDREIVEGRRELIVRARELMDTLRPCMETLMMVDAERDGDAVSAEISKRFAAIQGFGATSKCDWHEIEWDARIVFGNPRRR